MMKRNEKEFFLMVEGSQIDWAGYGHDKDYEVRQALLFDEEVKVALYFALEDKETRSWLRRIMKQGA